MKYLLGAVLFVTGLSIGFIGGIRYEKKQIKKQLECSGSLIIDSKEPNPTQGVYLQLSQDTADNLSKKSLVVLSVIKR